MDREYWVQVFVAYSRNMDFINDMKERRINTRVIRYLNGQGLYEYIISSEFEWELLQIMDHYHSEDYTFESHNLTEEM